MIDLTNNSFLRQCAKTFVADYTFIFWYFDIRLRSKKKVVKKLSYSYGRRPRVTIRPFCYAFSRTWNMILWFDCLNKTGCARIPTSRKVSGSQYPRNLRPNTLRASCTSFTSRLNDCGLFHVLIYRVCIAARVASVKEHSLLSSGTKRKKNSARVQKTASRFRSDDGLNTKSSRAIREGRFDFWQSCQKSRCFADSAKPGNHKWCSIYSL